MFYLGKFHNWWNFFSTQKFKNENCVLSDLPKPTTSNQPNEDNSSLPWITSNLERKNQPYVTRSHSFKETLLCDEKMRIQSDERNLFVR